MSKCVWVFLGVPKTWKRDIVCVRACVCVRVCVCEFVSVIVRVFVLLFEVLNQFHVQVRGLTDVRLRWSVAYVRACSGS